MKAIPEGFRAEHARRLTFSRPFPDSPLKQEALRSYGSFN